MSLLTFINYLILADKQGATQQSTIVCDNVSADIRNILQNHWLQVFVCCSAEMGGLFIGRNQVKSGTVIYKLCSAHKQFSIYFSIFRKTTLANY